MNPEHVPLILTIGLTITAILIAFSVMATAGIDMNRYYDSLATPSKEYCYHPCPNTTDHTDTQTTVANLNYTELGISLGLITFIVLLINKLLPPAILSLTNRNSMEN